MSDSEVLIKVENVSKKFCLRLKRSLWYGMQDLTAELIGRSNSHKNLRKDEFWAVKDVSFELRRGECLGLIGKNGSGKSTVLKMLNGLMKPDKGKITCCGRIGALIELGTGFNPILTGRENIYINASVLGMSKGDIDKKLQGIIDFAEIGEFIDAPVQSYSSGMKVRLGFAVAVQVEPDILLIDEVLAVGDVGFRTKCFNAINSMSKKAAIILVSHAMPQVARVCRDICVMNHGRAVFQGKDVPKGIEHYYSHFESQKGIITGNGKATIRKIEFESKGEKDVEQINHMDDLIVHMYMTVDPEVKHPTVSISFLNQELQMIALCSSLFNKVRVLNTGKPLHVALKLPAVNFNPGVYMLSVHISDEKRIEVFAEYNSVKNLKITGDFIGPAPVQLVGDWFVNQ